MKIILVLFICFTLCGCATTSTFNQSHNIHTGMAKEEVMQIYKPTFGQPSNYTRQNINGPIYETLYYAFQHILVGNFDFVDNILVGYYSNDHYSQ